jgi:hypothetical protein
LSDQQICEKQKIWELRGAPDISYAMSWKTSAPDRRMFHHLLGYEIHQCGDDGDFHGMRLACGVQGSYRLLQCVPLGCDDFPLLPNA